MQTFYSIFSNAFNMLEEAGPAHALREAQKITAFTNGIRDAEATRCAINARKEISSLPLNQQTFDKYFNSLSADLNTFQTLTLARMTESGTSTRRISSINTGRGRSGRTNGRGRGRSGRGRGGRGRGGRGGRHNDRGSFAPYSAQQRVFHPELRVYKPEEFSRLTRLQKSAILQHKLNHGWIAGDTPPHGYTLDNDGKPVPIGQISQASIAQMNSHPLPFGYPPPPNHSLQAQSTSSQSSSNNVPALISTNSGSAGASFGRQGTIVPSSASTTASISSVSIAGRAYNGIVYDSNGNRLN